VQYALTVSVGKIINRKIIVLLYLAMPLILAPSGAAFAENWPSWRGPRGDGTSLEKNVPRFSCEGPNTYIASAPTKINVLLLLA